MMKQIIQVFVCSGQIKEDRIDFTKLLTDFKFCGAVN
jgi:hypothetical protein